MNIIISIIIVVVFLCSCCLFWGNIKTIALLYFPLLVLSIYNL